MNDVRVDVRVSGDDGARIVRSLEAAGFVVSSAQDDTVVAPGRARVVIVEVESAFEVRDVLREWRSTAGAPPTVVLVAPEDADPAPFGAADAFFRRPVPIAELVRVVRGFLAADRGLRAGPRDPFGGELTARVEKRSGARSSSAPPGSGVSSAGVSSSGVVRAPATSPGPRKRGARRSTLSPALEDLLVAADRRLFPDATALPLDLPGGGARPADLVPDELLAAPVTSARESPPYGVVRPSLEEPPSDDAEDAAASTLPFVEARDAETPAPEPLAPTALLERRGPARRDETELLGVESGAALLLSLAGRASPQRVRFRDASGGEVALVIASGAVVDVEGPVDAEAARRLHREGRIAELPPAGDETAFLEGAVADGLVRRVDLARCRREGTEALVGAAALARADALTVESAEGAGPDAPRSRPLAAIVLEACRATAALPLGPGEAFFLREGAASALAGYGLLPEEVAALESLSGAPFGELHPEAHGLPGAAGLVALLLDLGLARKGEASSALRPLTPGAVRVHLATASARAVDGSYFEILGVPHDADAAAVERAHRRLSAELAGLDLAALGLGALEAERARLVESVDEAYAALRSERLRRAYAAALAAPEGGR